MLRFIKKHQILTICFILLLIFIISLIKIFFFLTEQIDMINQSDFGESNPKAINVSVESLIVYPEKYNGKLVRVTGIGNIQFESDCLFLSKEDQVNLVSENSISIDPNYKKLGAEEGTFGDLTWLNGNYVVVEGVFNSENLIIENVTKYKIVSKVNLLDFTQFYIKRILKFLSYKYIK